MKPDCKAQSTGASIYGALSFHRHTGTASPVNIVHVAECKHPEVAQAVAMLNDMSDKARKQALAHIGVIFKFDKGTF